MKTDHAAGANQDATMAYAFAGRGAGLPVSLRDELEEELERDLEVYVDSWAKLNGRPTQRMIRPDVDLSQSVALLNELGWILPLESHR